MSGLLLDWEVRFWNMIAKSNGNECPVYRHCFARVRNGWCPNEDKYKINMVIDNNKFNKNEYNFIKSGQYGQVLQDVEKLARDFLIEGSVFEPPVPSYIIKNAGTRKPIRIRSLPLRGIHGALWNEKDEWVIHLKRDDPLNQRRYTLFHEMFHIMGHKTMEMAHVDKAVTKRGVFIEVLADHFATSVLLPAQWVTEKWKSLQDLESVAHIFGVPKQVAFIRLRRLALI